MYPVVGWTVETGLALLRRSICRLFKEDGLGDRGQCEVGGDMASGLSALIKERALLSLSLSLVGSVIRDVGAWIESKVRVQEEAICKQKSVVRSLMQIVLAVLSNPVSVLWDVGSIQSSRAAVNHAIEVCCLPGHYDLVVATRVSAQTSGLCISSVHRTRRGCKLSCIYVWLHNLGGHLLIEELCRSYQSHGQS